MFVLSIIVAAFDTGFGILIWLLLIPINAAFQSQLAKNLEESAGESE